MVLLILMCLFSFACLGVSLLALGIVLKSTYFKRESSETKNSSYDLIVITGCDSGIGLEMAKYLYHNTEHTLLCGVLTTSSKGYKELQDLGADDDIKVLIPCKLDVTLDEDVEALKETIEELKSEKRITQVVALINNAGVMVYGEFDWLTWDQIQRQFDVNLVGAIRLTRALVPYIIQSKGRIINVSSVNDATVFPGLSIYSATKSALSTFSRGLGYELRKFGAHVVSLRLGDFACLTNIMIGHETRRDDMWNEMSSKKKSLYGDFFHEFHEHLLNHYGMTSPAKFEDSNLFSDLRLALLSERPPQTITCAPFGFRCFYYIIELLPIWFQYFLLDILMRFGFKWNPSRKVETANETKVSTSTGKR